MLLEIDKTFNVNSLPPVKKVVSLVPSLTETIASMGARSRLAGVTRFCSEPNDIRFTVPMVGGTKNFSVGKIEQLKPDCVLAVKEENTRDLILELAEKLPVVLFDIENLNDVYQMIHLLGRLLDKEKQALQMSEKIKLGFDGLTVNIEKRTQVLYLIWKDPWMAAGTDTFIGKMIELAGFSNIVSGRYPQVDDATFEQAELVLLSSEPYPFKNNHAIELRKRFPHQKFEWVEAKMFSWYGIRLMKSPAYFKLLWPENFKI